MSSISDQHPVLRPTGPYISDRPYFPNGNSTNQISYVPQWCIDESTILEHHKRILAATKDDTSLKMAQELYLIDRKTGKFHPYFEAQFLDLDPFLKDSQLDDNPGFGCSIVRLVPIQHARLIDKTDFTSHCSKC